MKGLRKILRISWTAKKTNEWVLNKAGVKRELLDTVKARKLAYYGHTMRKRKQGNCLEKEIMHGTMPGVRRRGRPRTAGIDNIKSWTGLSVEESIRMTEDRDKMEKVCPWCGQPSHWGWLEQNLICTAWHFLSTFVVRKCYQNMWWYGIVSSKWSNQQFHCVNNPLCKQRHSSIAGLLTVMYVHVPMLIYSGLLPQTFHRICKLAALYQTI